MTKGITLSILLIAFFLALGFISTTISFILLAPIIFTPKSILKEIFNIMKLENKDKVLDLGCGDGRLLFYIQNRIDIKSKNIKLFGYDISPILIIYCSMLQLFKLKRSITFDLLNIFEIKLEDYNKVYIYLDAKSIHILEKNIVTRTKTGIEIFSYRFPFKNIELVKEYILPNNEKLYKYIY